MSIALGLTILAGLAWVARAFYVETFKVASPGMGPNLLVGDHIVVRKDAYGAREHRLPARGDVVVFPNPEHPEQDDIGRVIGLPGDTLSVEQAAVFINGWRIPTCVMGVGEVNVGDADHAGIAVVELLADTAYIVFHDQPKEESEEGSEGHHHGAKSEGPYTVPNQEVFVLGDNREHSHDSRYWFAGRGGGVRLDQIKGRASTIGMSFARSGRATWSRVGSSLLGAPQCPQGFPPPACAALERCLASPPSRDVTTPPPGRSLDVASP